MNITVPDWAMEHFFEEPPKDTIAEFWAFRWPQKCKPGDKINFYNLYKKKIAESVVLRVENPGESECATSGKFGGRWKVFWKLEDFKDLRTDEVKI